VTGKPVIRTTRDDVLRKLTENEEAIRRFRVRRLGIFGSCARGDQTETSDMDFLVEFDEPSLDNYLDLKEFLENLFGCPVDLVFSDVIKPRLRPIILKEVVYAPGF
jgi:predicted nucleotidyltransferase